MAVLLLAYIGLSTVVTNSYYQLMLTLVPVWAVLGLSWNLFSGYVGLTSFGHAAFFGLGAYTVALGLTMLNLTPWIGIPIAALLGAAAALLIGLPTFRLRGHYFALAMLAYPLLMSYLAQYLGLQEVSLPMRRDAPAAWLQFSDPRIYTWLGLGLLALALAISMVVENSRFGLSLMAIRQNELAAEAAGINVRMWKMRALMLSGAMAGAAGGFYACILLVVTPEAVFGMLVSAQALVVALFGGVGTYWGPLIGAAILIPLSETLHAELGEIIPGIQGVVYGAAIILIMLLAPEGLFWSLRDRWSRRSAEALVPGAIPVPIQKLPVMPAEAVAPKAPSGRTLLEVRGLCKSFGGLKAVDDVSFSVKEGTILGIIGPNGAGKTSMFNALNGVLRPDRGEALLDGQQLVGRKLHEICRLGVGRTFQVVRSFPRLPLLDNVLVGAYGAGLADEEAVAAAREAIARTGLSHLTDAPAGGLTNKELRLMELARALAGRPRLLLLDETLAGLGREECDAVLDVLHGLRAEGMTTIIIEHTMHAMLRVADELLVIDRGRVLSHGMPREVVEDRMVIEAYLGKKWLAQCST
ncbi:ATP-binding cassette domain-containing protein [Pseudoroseomonas wenyumeiae]|uniref:ATP-binding cassette domain-containing protein n=1 Tax=Teichococcus wenyumeiae TaxID=2478470 RepID=A0A3A9JZG2_9PROT|nr:branched-chain amino acid ABC transporter ATP-binding protein/permease [Pseudoroseomonas wenyumeiae]RKK06258.1 ATP-binding cassette domain-containing protein [Pseudoroseomonas wenyumeiae]RMI19764.1 ATP-binding cassette domain-containing protein [Pseudoroseomonas wenyumeiae]